MLLRGAGCPMATAGACVTVAVDTVDGAATADDIRRLIDRCRIGVRERFGVELREEIVYLGSFE